MALQRGVYRPRDAEHAVLHQVIAEHLEAFLRAVAEAGDGAGLPQFVEREFREFVLPILCLRFNRRLATPPARLEARMDSLFSFPVGLFHPLQHAGLSRRTRSSDYPTTESFRLGKPSRSYTETI